MTRRSVKPTIYALSTIMLVIILALLLLSNIEKSTDERIQARKAKEEKKRKEAILRAQKKRRNQGKESSKAPSLYDRKKKSGFIGKLIAVACVFALLISTCVAISVFTEKTVELNVYNWGEYISDG